MYHNTTVHRPRYGGFKRALGVHRSMARKVVQKGAHFILDMRLIAAEDLTHTPLMSAPRAFPWMSVGAVQVQPVGVVHHVSFAYYNTTIHCPNQHVF